MAAGLPAEGVPPLAHHGRARLVGQQVNSRYELSRYALLDQLLDVGGCETRRIRQDADAVS